MLRQALGVSLLTRLPLFFLLLLLCPAASAQEPAAQCSLRVVCIKGSGLRKAPQKPAIPPELKRYQPLLRVLEYDRFSPVKLPKRSKGLVRGEAGVEQTIKLPLDHEATLSWRAAKEPGRLELKVRVTKAAKAPESKRKQVVKMTVSIKDGGHYVIKCTTAFPDGDLLLLVTASKAPLR